jgi:hypothetical protein
VLANVRAQSTMQGPDPGHSAYGVLLATDGKYLAPALPYRGRIVPTLVDALPWGEVEAALVRPDGYVCWAAPGEDVIGPAQAWFGSPR